MVASELKSVLEKDPKKKKNNSDWISLQNVDLIAPLQFLIDEFVVEGDDEKAKFLRQFFDPFACRFA